MPAILQSSNPLRMSTEDENPKVEAPEGDTAKADPKVEEKKDVAENGDLMKDEEEEEGGEPEAKPEKKEKTAKRKPAPTKKVKNDSDEDVEQADEGSDLEEESPKKKKATPKKSTAKKAKRKETSDEEDEEEEVKVKTPKKRASPAKRKETSDEEDEEEEVKVKTPKKRASPAKRKETSEEEDEKEEVKVKTPKKRASPKKKVAKKENDDIDENENEDEESQEDEEEEEEEEELKKKGVPLLDQPLEVVGARERKKVSRFEEEFMAKGTEEKKFEVPQGSGTELGQIPRIELSLAKYTTEKLKPVGKALFGKAPPKSTAKKCIRSFSGLDFDEKSDKWEARKAYLTKFGQQQLKFVCEVLDLERRGTVSAIVDRLMHFMASPKDSGKKLPQARSKRKSVSKAGRKTYAESEDSDDKPAPSGRRKGKRQSLKDVSNSDTDEGVKRVAGSRKKKAASYKDESSADEKEEKVEDEKEDDVDDQETEKQENAKSKGGATKSASDGEDLSVKDDNENEDSEPEEPKAKRGRKTPAKRTPAKAARKTPAKKTPAKKRNISESDAEKDGSSSEDEPLIKKAKPSSPPTDEEIKTYVKKILEGANLEEITMKTVCKQVYEHYPDHDLAHKKELIKDTVKSLIAT